MKKLGRFSWGVIAATLISVGTFGVADAQVGSPPVPRASGDAASQRPLTPAEQLTQAEAVLNRMESARQGVHRQLEAARNARDVVKVLCLNDKLTQIDVASRSAQDRRTALSQAAGRQDRELATHEFLILSALRLRVEQLSAEANQCVGVDTYYFGESRITTSIDPSIPEQDTALYPESPLIGYIPSCASCIY